MCAFFIFSTNDIFNIKCLLTAFNKNNSSLLLIHRATILTFLKVGTQSAYSMSFAQCVHLGASN